MIDKNKDQKELTNRDKCILNWEWFASNPGKTKHDLKTFYKKQNKNI